jgi:hypothetical protein
MSVLLDLTADEECDNDIEKENNKAIILVCIDPAPINCGISVYDTSTSSFLQVETKCFYQKQNETDTDLGNVGLLDSVSRFIKRNPVFQKENTLVFIENQTVGGSDGHSLSNAKNVAVQYCFQSILGAKRCIPIPPSSVKAHFRHEFPLLEHDPKVKKSTMRDRQYRLDKKNAIRFGSRLVGADIKRAIAKQRNKKIDDSYDAVVINQYALECFQLEFSEEKQRVLFTKLAKKRVRKAKTARKPRCAPLLFRKNKHQ